MFSVFFKPIFGHRFLYLLSLTICKRVGKNNCYDIYSILSSYNFICSYPLEPILLCRKKNRIRIPPLFRNNGLVKTHSGFYLTSLTTSMSTMYFLIEIMSISKAMKSHFSRSYDKHHLTLVVISYEIYVACQRRVS